MVVSVLIGRERSVLAVQHAWDYECPLVLVTQQNPDVEEPGPEDLYAIGVLAHVTQFMQVPDGTVRIVAETRGRVRIDEVRYSQGHLTGSVVLAPEELSDDLETQGLVRLVHTQFEHLVQEGRQIPVEALNSIAGINEPAKLAYAVLSHLGYLPSAVLQEFLETENDKERLRKLLDLLYHEAAVLEVQQEIRARVERELGESQREMILREQLKAIQEELTEHAGRESEADEYRRKIRAAGMPEQTEQAALKEVDRVERMPYGAPEGVVIRNYLDWLIALPWSKASDDRLDVDAAAAALDEDHYGLDKAKARILEYLAVRKLVGNRMKGPILCFVGPPGTGKTSIGRSIARAMGRQFVRISLGGVRDEAEIRGHRRTYVGALPGRIMQGIRHAGVRNPVFMLDEIDKLGYDFRGDPSSALLEALDPEQNAEFSDHYIELPFDLREVLFITTANFLDNLPPALRDRMEIITFPGYTEYEKQAIAERFLCPKQIAEHGLDPRNVSFEAGAILRLIREYTREAGVRALERSVAAICRKIARQWAAAGVSKVRVAAEALEEYLGHPRFRYGAPTEGHEIGAVNGLVFTEAGGDVVTVEVILIRGNVPRLTLTGQLGEVMRESAQAALTCIRARAEELGVDSTFGGFLDVHVHVPEGAVPKDGPSAGIAIATAIASAATRRPVKSSIAMTGEVTLRGKVLPVGGIKEKALGAHRAGLRTVILPAHNMADLDDVPGNIRAEVQFEPVMTLDQVLELALLPSAAN